MSGPDVSVGTNPVKGAKKSASFKKEGRGELDW